MLTHLHAFENVGRRHNLYRRTINLRLVGPTVIFALLVLLGCEGGAPVPNGHPLEPGTNRLEAVVLDARSAPSDSALHAIADLGVTHLALVSFGFQAASDDPHITFRPDVGWYSESREGVRSLARRADELGMGLILKPQVWIRGGEWTADIDFETEADWAVWEAGYRAYLLYVARLAQEVNADLLIVGTELANPVRQRPAFWRRLIDEIRTTYDGRLTYGANWHDDYQEVPFWDALDAIGVQAYFPISTRSNPDVTDLMEGWTTHLDEIRRVSASAHRPVLFTEVGYRSVPYAAAEPWRWPSREEVVEPNYALQADLYTAFFASFWDRPWFGGAIVWKLYPDTGRRGHALDFTPQGKPAEMVLRDWFSRP